MEIKVFFYVSLLVFAISSIVLVILAVRTLIKSSQKQCLTKDDLYNHKEIHEKFIQYRAEEQNLQDSMVRSSVRMHHSLYLLEDEFQNYKNNVLLVKLPQKAKDE